MLGGLLMWSPTQGQLNIPFEASVFNGDGTETKVNIEYDLTGYDAAALTEVDESIILQVQARSQDVFKKFLSIDAVRERYTPLVKRKEGYPPRLKTKIDLERVRVWNLDKELIGVPPSFKNCQATPLVKLKHVWFMNNGFGISVETIDIQIKPPIMNCPF